VVGGGVAGGTLEGTANGAGEKGLREGGVVLRVHGRDLCDKLREGLVHRTHLDLSYKIGKQSQDQGHILTPQA